MIYLILTLVLVAAAAALSLRRVGPGEQLVVQRFGKVRGTVRPGVAFVVPLVDRTWRVDTRPRQRYAATTTTTSDGASAHLRLEYTLRISDAGLAPELLEGAVRDAVEERLRSHINEHPAHRLPNVDQVLDWAPDSFVPGVLVTSAQVTVLDVEPVGEPHG
jgi:regulator of protease activity HflC (stomatin/prohibitin superfamily)